MLNLRYSVAICKSYAKTWSSQLTILTKLIIQFVIVSQSVYCYSAFCAIKIVKLNLQ